MNDNKRIKLINYIYPVGFVTLMCFTLLLLVFYALKLHLPNITTHFVGDELEHNYAVVHPTNLKWMLELVAQQHQPFLDYFLRRHIWVEFMGHNEIAFRLPNLFYSLITVILSFLLPWYYLKSKKIPKGYLLGISITTAFLVLKNPTQIQMAVYARHYSLVSLTSVLWVFVFLLDQGKKKNYRLAIASLLFLNTHFFSLPLVIGGYGYIGLRHLLTKRYKAMLISLMTILILVVITIGINYRSFFGLLLTPHGIHSVPLIQAIQEGLRKYTVFTQSMLLLLPSFAFLAMNLLFIKREENQKIIFLTFIILPLFLMYMSQRSGHRITYRHYTPYFGLGVGLFTLFLYNLYNIVEKLRSFIRSDRQWRLVRNGLTGLLFGIILFMSQAHLLPGDLLKDRGNLQIPPKNFSKLYQSYQELKQYQVPLFLISSFYGQSDFGNYLYMRWMGTAGFERGYDFGFETVNSYAMGRHIAVTVEGALDRLQRFIEMNPKGKIVLDHILYGGLGWEDFTNVPLPDDPLIKQKVQRLEKEKNVWILSDITSIDQVYRIAKILKFPGKMFEKEIKAEKVSTFWEGSFSYYEKHPEYGTWRWSGNQGSIRLRNNVSSPITVTLRTEVEVPHWEKSSFTIEYGAVKKVIPLRSSAFKLEESFTISARSELVVSFLSNARPIHAPPDYRELVFRFKNPVVSISPNL